MIDRTPGAAALRKRGNAHLQEGEVAEAAECYRQAMAADPADANACVSLGFALREMQRIGEAEAALQKAVALDPNVADAHYLLGTLAHARNASDEAIGYLRRAVEVQPDLDVAYQELFALLFRGGQLAEAQEVIGRAITRWPQAADLRCYLGNLLSQRGEYAAAAASYREAVALAPEVPGVHNDLGCALEKLGQLDEAAASYQAALALRPDYADALINLGNVRMRQGKLAEAQALYERAVAANPQRAEGHSSLGSLLMRQGDSQGALQCYREVVRLDPSHSAAHIVAALSGVNADRPPSKYVERLFDEFAETFEEQLVSILKYDIPRQLLTTIEALVKPRAGQWDVLDLGCGTGLAGAAIAPYARQLVGVDLSSKMLAKAAARGVYQRLENLDLLAAMREENDSTYDLVLAADVFIYVGRLDELAAEAGRILRPGGLMGFSTEDIEAGGSTSSTESPDYQLKQTVRYGHSPAYLRQLAAEHGFTVRHMRPVQVRTEGGKPVHGHVVVWARSASSA